MILEFKQKMRYRITEAMVVRKPSMFFQGTQDRKNKSVS